jgi:hypothetical protein
MRNVERRTPDDDIRPGPDFPFKAALMISQFFKVQEIYHIVASDEAKSLAMLRTANFEDDLDKIT